MVTRPGDSAETSLEAAMRAPSTIAPDVVVLDYIEEERKAKDMADPKKDLWLSTVDGRYSSAIIPVRVGPYGETFPVHRDILTKSEYFRRALDGEFREGVAQAIDLPEEDPDIFSFVVAYLYEEKFVPIKAMSHALVAQPDKGKGREENEEVNSGSDDGSDSLGSGSDESTRSRRRASRRRRQERVAWERQRRKEPGRHRPDCNCATCSAEQIGPPCWSCGAARRPPPPRHRQYYGPPPPQPVVMGRNGYPMPQPPRHIPRDRDRRRGGPPQPPNGVVLVDEPLPEERLTAEDLRTWSLAYSLSVDVYVCAERYLMQDFKTCIAALIINSFEIAGLEAALPAVLQSCKTLHYGVSSMDPLLKKVFARVGFMYSRICKNYPEESQAFFAENPELALSIMKEMVERREEDRPDNLPPMDRPSPFPFGNEEIVVHGPRHGRRYDGPIYR